MFTIKIGRGFELSVERDFLLRVNRWEFYWSKEDGFRREKV